MIEELADWLADEVVGSLLELFTLREMDTSWHGDCLALAKLGRRGFLLPGRLVEVLQCRLPGERWPAGNIPARHRHLHRTTVLPDYQAMGSRSNSYLDISVFIAGYQKYSRALVVHLIEKKVGHWDTSERELSDRL